MGHYDYLTEVQSVGNMEQERRRCQERLERFKKSKQTLENDMKLVSKSTREMMEDKVKEKERFVKEAEREINGIDRAIYLTKKGHDINFMELHDLKESGGLV